MFLPPLARRAFAHLFAFSLVVLLGLPSGGGLAWADEPTASDAAAEAEAARAAARRLVLEMSTNEAERVARARAAMARLPDTAKRGALEAALGIEPVSLRLYAARELARIAEPASARILLDRAVHDPHPAVRKATAEALAKMDVPGAVHPLGRALGSGSERIRVRAAEALGRLGDELGMPYILRRWRGQTGDFPRAYFAGIEQQSVIADYDVEVACESWIADPIVGVAQEGAVIEVKVVGVDVSHTTLEREAFRTALERLSGQALGRDPRRWTRWWTANEARLLEARRTRAASRRDSGTLATTSAGA